MKGRLRDFALRAFRRAGYELIPRWRLPGYQLSTHLRSVFSHYGVNVVADVGANRGQYRYFLKQEVDYAGRVASFEPVPALAAELLERSAADESWTVHPMALGSQEGSVEINVMSADVFSSFLDPLEAPDDDTYRTMNVVKDKVMVPVRRLDGMVSELGLTNAEARLFLKMDTQGFDLEVFKGAKGVLDHVVAIQSEVSVIPLYGHMPDMWTQIEFFREHGFELSGLFPVSQGSALRVIEFDCVMVKDATAPRRGATAAARRAAGEK